MLLLTGFLVLIASLMGPAWLTRSGRRRIQPGPLPASLHPALKVLGIPRHAVHLATVANAQTLPDGTILVSPQFVYPPDQMAAIMAHEWAHTVHHDARTLAALVALWGLGFVIQASAIVRWHTSSLWAPLWAVPWTLGLVISLIAVSRRQEWQADAWVVQHHPEWAPALASVLSHLPSASAHWWHLHPSPAERLAALEVLGPLVARPVRPDSAPDHLS